jgi:hypothetical protein
MTVLRGVRRVAPAWLLACVAACTDPTSVGDAPAFVTLERVSEADSPVGVLDLAPSACPVIDAPDPAWTRQPVTGSAATIALAPTLVRETAGFGTRPGRVFVDRWLAVVAVTFDDDLARLSPASIMPTSDGVRPAPFRWFGGRCRIMLDGRPATLLVQLVLVQSQDGSVDFSRREPALPAAILRTGPDGRQTNVMIEAIDGLARPFRTNPDGRRLLSMAASLRW